jgi:DNA polymerase-3 subunit delta'
MTSVSPWLKARLAQALADERRAHGLLIQGPNGVGKTNFTAGLALALTGTPVSDAELTADEAWNWLHREPGEPPIAPRPDIKWLAPERSGGSIGVEPIRELLATLSLTSHGGKGKVAVIAPAEAMTLAAANALLKTLEEPTADTHLLLVSHRPGLLPATILSRCQRLTIRAPSQSVGLDWLGQSGHATAGEWAELLTLARQAPWQALALKSNNYLKLNKELELLINSISSNDGDPIATAASWAKGDTAVFLDWLVGYLERALRAESTGRNGVTELNLAILHNVRQPGRLLFRLLDETRNLREAIGTGINMELALRALLQELVPPFLPARN